MPTNVFVFYLLWLTSLLQSHTALKKAPRKRKVRRMFLAKRNQGNARKGEDTCTGAGKGGQGQGNTGNVGKGDKNTVKKGDVGKGDANAGKGEATMGDSGERHFAKPAPPSPTSPAPATTTWLEAIRLNANTHQA